MTDSPRAGPVGADVRRFTSKGLAEDRSEPPYVGSYRVAGAIAIVALLALVVALFGKSWKLEWAEFGFDLPVAAATTTSRPKLNAEAMEAVLHENASAAEKSRRIVELLPQLPTVRQAEAAQHLVSFATDATPEGVVEPLLDTNTYHRAHGVLIFGLLQRADRIRLPALLKVARNPDHSKCDEALRYLQFLLQSDEPADSDALEAMIEARVKRGG